MTVFKIFKMIDNKFFIFLLLLIQDIGNSSILHTNKNGLFWQITDIHWDQKYSEHGDSKNMCHKLPEETSNGSLGYFGNYLCDSPYPLVKSALQAMKKLEANPELILWTGDNAPHTKDLNFEIIFRTLRNLTSEISSTFGPSVPLIPVLGNHDSYPKDDYPASGESFYRRYLSEGGWDQVIPLLGHKTFIKGGYYVFPARLDLDILVLNTNIYYRYNELGKNLSDPSGQFEWMKQKLQEAKDSNKKVIITAHAPPGYWERNAQVPFFNDSYNDHFIDVVNDFGDVIIAQIYGHEHTDSFRIFGTMDDVPQSVGFLAPSVTPWFPLRLTGGTAINPSLRLYTFSSNLILDYVQYHMNLSEANNDTATSSCDSSIPPGKCLKDLWHVYYRATEFFGVKSLDANAMNEAYGKLILNDTFFQKYFTLNSAGIEHGYCNETCKTNQFCAIRHQKISSLSDCFNRLSDFNFTLYYEHLFTPNLSASTNTSSILPFMKGELHTISFRWVVGIIIFTLIFTISGLMYIMMINRKKTFFPAGEAFHFDWMAQDSHKYRQLRTREME